MKFVLCSSILAVSTLSAFAQQPPTPAAEAAPVFKAVAGPIDLQDGDSLVFLGDSITHQCLYTQYVEDYFYTRFPKRHLHFHNAGVGGDRASNALLRFDEDVASFKPKYVTILLGMNDGGYKGYDQPTFDTYQKDMSTVLDKIAELHAVAVPMTPTMHDPRPVREAKHGAEPRDTYYNGVLALYGAWLREQAQQRGLGFIDMWGPLNSLTLEQRKKDATWTMIRDGVHPGPTGQTVMAASVINDEVAHSAVSEVSVWIEQGQPAANSQHGVVGDLKKTEKGVSFSFAAEALPWVLPPDAAEGLKLTHIGHKFSTEKLAVRDLAPGKYELKIDGQAVGTYETGPLAAGIELQENDKTPEYQQALKVALLNKKRNDEAVHPLRDQWAALKNKTNDLHKAEAANAADLADKKAVYDQWLPTFKTAVENLNAKAAEMEKAIYEINQPQPHTYELTHVEG